MSFLSFLTGLGAGIAFLKGQNLLGGILTQIASIMDGVDGDLARLKRMVSPFGAFFDAVLDRYADAAIVLGMTWWTIQHEDFAGTWLVGILALLGSLMVSYSRARAEASLRTESNIPLLSKLANRDTRLFLVMLGGILGKGYWTLLALAILTHLIVLFRILYFAKRLAVSDQAQSEEGR
jgi:phosphatidylglycerophosphate synthase